MKTVLKTRPWLFVVAAFVLLVAAWTALIWIAEKNRPEPVPLKEFPAAAKAPRGASE